MIIFFKLWNGEEIVAEAEIDGEWSEEIELRKPLRHMMSPQGPILVPYPCESVTISKQHIVFHGTPYSEVMNGYRQATGGVVIPNHDLQLPS